MHVSKKSSKFICSLLTAAMLFSSIPVCAFAEDEINEPAVETTTTVEPEIQYENTIAETSSQSDDENVTSIPEDETIPEGTDEEEIEVVPITEETDVVAETSEETTTDETTTEVATETEATDETVVETEETDVITEETLEEESEELEELEPTFEYSVSLPSDMILREEDETTISASVIATMTEFNIVEDEDGVQSYEEVTSDVDYTFEFSIDGDGVIVSDTTDETANFTFNEVGDITITGSLIVDGEVVASDSMLVSVLPGFVEFDHYYSEIDESLIQTSDLFVQASSANVFTRNTEVVSNFDNVYIISFEDVQTARYAYSYYVDKVSAITDLSNVISISTDENVDDVADMSNVNEGEDAIANLNDIDTTPDYSGYIALIDTGANTDIAYSVVGEDTSDNCAHGSEMLAYILEENPNAQVISIKVSEDGSANAADIYAGFRLAMDLGVSYINFSMTGLDTENNAIIKNIIQEAINNGIVVIGAAGNYSVNSRYFISGCINDVITVGAINEDKTKVSTSNYNADLYIIANTTSEAAARFTGLYTTFSETYDIDSLVNRFDRLVHSVEEDENFISEDYEWAYEVANELTVDLREEYGYGYVEPFLDENNNIGYRYIMEPISEAEFTIAAYPKTDAYTTVNMPAGVTIHPGQSGTDSGTCSFTSIAGGKGNASGFSSTSHSTALTIGQFVSNMAVTMICSKNFGHTESDHALSLSTGTMVYNASYTVDANNRITWTVQIGKGDTSQPEWTTIRDNPRYEVISTGTTTWTIVFNGTRTEFNALNSNTTIQSVIRRAIDVSEYSGNKNCSVVDNWTGGTGTFTASRSYQHTDDTQVYEGRIFSTGGTIPAEGSVTFGKYDGDGNNLAGAVIEFSCIGGPGATYDEFSNITATGTSGWNRTGTASRQFTTTTSEVTIDHLAPNSTYRFHEVSAPDAAYILSEDKVFTTDANGNASIGMVTMTDDTTQHYNTSWSAFEIRKYWESDPNTNFTGHATALAGYLFYIGDGERLSNFHNGIYHNYDMGDVSGTVAWGNVTLGAYGTASLTDDGLYYHATFGDWSAGRNTPFGELTSSSSYPTYQYYSYILGDLDENTWISTLHGLPDGYYEVSEAFSMGRFGDTDRVIPVETNGWTLMPEFSNDTYYRYGLTIHIENGIPYICDWYTLQHTSALTFYRGPSPDYYTSYYYTDLYNIEQSGQLDVTKIDQSGNIAAGTATIRFELYDGSDMVASSGNIVSTGANSNGFDTYDVTWNYTTYSADSPNNYQGGYELTRHDHTNESIIAHIPYGTYELREYINNIDAYRTPDGWTRGNGYFYRSVTIDSGAHASPLQVEIVNRDWSIHLNVTKFDEATDSTVINYNGTFAVDLYADLNGDGVAQSNEILVTNATDNGTGADLVDRNGIINFNVKFSGTEFAALLARNPGAFTLDNPASFPTRYLVVERSAPAGYYVNPNPVAVTLNMSNEYTGDTSITDTPYIPLEFTVNKIDEETGDVLTGASFALYIDVNEDGILDANDQLLDTLSDTDNDGVVVFSYTLTPEVIADKFADWCIDTNGNITGDSAKNYPTHYLAVETVAPADHYLNEVAFALELEGGRYSDSAAIYATDLLYINLDFDVDKYDLWEHTILQNYKGDYDATFELYVDVNANGQLDSEDRLLDTLADTDRDGHVDFSYTLTPEFIRANLPECIDANGNVTGGSARRYPTHYLVREVVAPFDFYLNNTVYTVTLAGDQYRETAPVVDVDDTPYQAQINIIKLDGDTDASITNAIFTVYNDVNDNHVFDEGIDTVATTYDEATNSLIPATFTYDSTNEYYVSSLLRSGHYIVVETGLPTGYFYVDSNGVPTLARNEVYIEIVPRDTSAADFAVDTYEATFYNLAPSIGTTFRDPMTESQTAHIDEDIVLIDTVAYHNLIPDVEYVMSGIIMLKETGEPLLDENGNTITGETVFTPHSADGTVDVEFHIDTLRLMRLVEDETIHAPVDLVAFEYLDFSATTDLTPYHQWYDEGPFVTHEDINDYDQTVRVGQIKTGVYDSEGLDHIATYGPNGDGLAHIIDNVHYEGLQPGATYVVYGHLHLVDYDENGNIIDGGVINYASTGEVLEPYTVFTPTSHEGYVQVEFVIDTNRFRGETVVSFEDLYWNNVHIMWHTDIEDEAQTFVIPDVHTNAYCPDTTPNEMGRTVITYSETARIVDEVYYENVLPGRQYMVQGSLYWVYTDDNGSIHSGPVSAILGDTQAMSTAIFTADSASGMVEMTFTFDSTVLADLHYDKLIVMETLFMNGGIGWKPIAHHWDFSMTNNSQSIEIPQLHTTATDGDTGGKILTQSTTATVVDRVYYENLVPGTEYTVVGNVQYAKTDSNGNVIESGALVQNGQEVRAQATFVPTESTGYIDLTFTVNALEIDSSVSKLVVFEELYVGPGVRVSVHADITDEEQTISVPLNLHVRIAKADADNINYMLAGAEITIFNGDGTVATDINGNPCVGVTGADGIVEFTIVYLSGNNYYAMETAAPEGYDINPDKFYIYPDTSREADGTCLIPISILDQALTIPPRVSIPPRTGDTIATIVIVAVLAVCGIGAGAYFVISSKKKKVENNPSEGNSEEDK